MSHSPLFKNLGTGVGLRPSFVSEFIGQKPSSIQWVEVISENFMRWDRGNLPRWPIDNLENVRRELPVALHGVSMSLGAAEDLDSTYMKHLKEIVNRIHPVYVSDHLCWTGTSDTNLHDLLPLPYTFEVASHVAGKIKKAQDFLGRRMLIENLSTYLEFKSSEMEEWEFLSEISNSADCGLLLDINNVFVSSVNHKFDPKTYLDNIPHHRVGQIHLAGHTVKNGFMIDTHDALVCNEVWDLYQYYVSTYGAHSSMIERDSNIPEWSELEKEVMMIDAKMQAAAIGGTREKSFTAPAVL